MSSNRPLTATILAGHTTRSCDLYLSNVYHKSATGIKEDSELSKAHFARGLSWESNLFSWLDKENLLLEVQSNPIQGSDLLENIYFDERDHFFISNLTFQPPHDYVNKRYLDAGFEPVQFGIAKPDLLEIIRRKDGIEWKVIDAKSSRVMKTSHQVQIYLYTEWLQHLLPSSSFISSGFAGVWLPPADSFDTDPPPPSFNDLQDVSIGLLKPSLDDYIFRQLPQILAQATDSVSWHLNPLCKGCPYFQQCSSVAKRDGKIGLIPNISLDDYAILRTLLGLHRGHGTSQHSNDIEDLGNLTNDSQLMNRLESTAPGVVKRARKILSIPRKNGRESAAVTSAKSQEVRIIPQLRYTFPKEEDVAIIMALVQDPVLPDRGVCSFEISAYSPKSQFTFDSLSGHSRELVPAIASIVRAILNFQSSNSVALRCQFYVFSPAEAILLQHHIVSAALHGWNEREDVALCIGAVAEGASLLQTTFQPLILSELLDFAIKTQAPKAEIQAYLARLSLPTDGTLPVLRDRIKAEIAKLKIASGGSADNRRKELGQLPKVVIVQKEIGSLVALPIPGFWDLPQCAAILVPHWTPKSDDAIFEQYRHSSQDVHASLLERNDCVFAIINDVRRRVLASNLLVNEARTLSINFMDICHQNHLRKLFYMQQFEVLAKLGELWKKRIEGCPDAPLLTYSGPVQGRGTTEHEFVLSCGSVEVPSDKERPFYDFLLCPDDDGDSGTIPVEAVFDDLAVSGLVFPLNRWTRSRWDTQDSYVKRSLLIADVQDVAIRNKQTVVTLRIWNNGVFLRPQKRYRISPRYVDFNINKALSCLVDMDLKFSGNSEDEKTVPFLHLIVDPKGFSRKEDDGHTREEFLRAERNIQRLYRELGNLDVPGAKSLLLKDSQRQATQRILTGRLSVIWGPPGTGKTYTLALSLLRLINVERSLGDLGEKIILVTAMTHAALDAFMSKLDFLIGCTKGIDSLDQRWLDKLSVERVRKGSDHPAPSRQEGHTIVYVGTVYQLFNFSKKNHFQVDCLIIDEAGQLSLSSASLAFRNVGSNGRVVIAGDSEQLAPILAGTYPETSFGPLFGSILDYIMHTARIQDVEDSCSLVNSQNSDYGSSQGTVVQLTENFRLNPDMGEFISTIYSRRFKPQKVQARELALALRSIRSYDDAISGAPAQVSSEAKSFLLALSDVMLKRDQTILSPPTLGFPQQTTAVEELAVHLPVSLVLIELETEEGTEYEAHVRSEAMLGACIVTWLRRCGMGEDIFVATPHRVQRQAVKTALNKIEEEAGLMKRLERLDLGDDENEIEGKVTVDTIERLQGSEAGFVICLFTVPHGVNEADFLLERRRLNVAISRAKTLCITVTSKELLKPPLKVLGKEETRKGYAFLKAYEERAWKGKIRMNSNNIE